MGGRNNGLSNPLLEHTALHLTASVGLKLQEDFLVALPPIHPLLPQAIQVLLSTVQLLHAAAVFFRFFDASEMECEPKTTTEARKSKGAF